MNLDARCRPIELILADVDGVLTDGTVILSNDGLETKGFHIRDGLGIKLWQRAGYRFGIVTGRSSHVVQVRAAELGVEIVRQGVDRKLAVVQEIAAGLSLKPNQVCFVGDDLPDLAPVRWAGLGVAVADACPELKQAAAYATTRTGGRGALRETIEVILKAQQRWTDVIQKYET